MLNSISETLSAFDAYKGGRTLIIVGLIAVLYIFILEERREIKELFTLLPLFLLALFFFPVFSYVAGRYFLEGGVYYRLLWLIPFTVITAYAFVRVISHINENKKRLIVGVLLSLVVIQSGSLIYLNPLVKPAENIYHLPDYVIQTADVMRVPGRNVKAVVPGEMLQFIRQYDPSIELAYGREALVEGWSDNPLYDAMEKNPVKSFELTDLSRQQGVEYIVLRTGTGIVGTNHIESLEYTLISQTAGYDIYIFDRAEFAPRKKEQYLKTLSPDRHDYYINAETGPNSEYK